MKFKVLNNAIYLSIYLTLWMYHLNVLTNALSRQIFSEVHALLSLFAYVRPNDNPVSTEWSPAQFEELQLQVSHIILLV